MKKSRKQAKAWIDGLTKSKFNAAVDELKLTPFQREILIMRHVNGFDNTRIAIETMRCKEQISTELSKIYERIATNFLQ